MEGAEALKKLARSLIDSYRNVISAGMELRTKAAPMEKGNSPIYDRIDKEIGEIDTCLRTHMEDFLLLADNLHKLADRMTEILGSGGGSSGEQMISTGVPPFGESVPEKNFMDQFHDGIFRQKTLELAEPAGGQHFEWTHSNEITGIFHNDDTAEDQFWTHHGNTKERYRELASHVNMIRWRLECGHQLEDIRKDPSLTACVDQYFDPQNAVRVYKYGDRYIAEGGGRHRVRIAQEMGIDIPVLITREVRTK